MRPFLLCIILVLFSLLSKSQGLQDTVIVLPVANITGAKLFLPEEAGMKTTHIDTLVMMEKLTSNLSDLLSENSHVFIKSYGRGAMATASFRGTAPSHTQVYWNGMNINSPMLGMVDFSLIPVYILDDISLNHGTSSIKNGTGGLGGSINLSNRTEWESGLDIKALSAAGSYSTYENFLSVKVGNESLQSKTRLYHSASQNDYTFLNRYNFDIDPLTGGFIYPLDTNKNAAYSKYGVLQEIYLRSKHGAEWSVKYWGQNSEREIPGVASYEGNESDRLNKLSEASHSIVLNRKIATEKYSFDIQTGARIHNMNYYLKNFIPGYGFINSVYSVSEEKSVLAKADYSRYLDNNFSVNTSLQWNYHDVNTLDTVTSEGYESTRNAFSLLVAVRKRFFEHLNTSFMIRQGIIDGVLTPPAPFLGFDLLVAPKFGLIIKGNIAANYHQPSLNDMYWLPGGNPDLKPERGYSSELGAETILKFGNLSLIPDITLFYSDIDDWIIWTYSGKGYWTPQNIKRVVTAGMESSVKITRKIREIEIHASGTYSYTRALNYGDVLVWGDESYGKQLVYIPVHSGNVMVGLEWKNWNMNYQHNSYSERFVTSSNDLSSRSSIYPYFMNDLKVGRKIAFQSFDISAELKINNLFNEEYHTVLMQPMPGINFMFQLMFDLH